MHAGGARPCDRLLGRAAWKPMPVLLASRIAIIENQDKAAEYPFHRNLNAPAHVIWCRGNTDYGACNVYTSRYELDRIAGSSRLSWSSIAGSL